MAMPAPVRAIVRLMRGVAWLGFPLVPTLLGGAYHRIGTLAFFGGGQDGPDPYDWDAWRWLLLLGPLLGYGFLAGATWGIADEPEAARWWRLWRRRSLWVGIGPWFGFASAVAVVLIRWAIGWLLQGIAPEGLASASLPEWLNQAVLVWIALGWIALGWLPVAWLALRRARRARRGRSALWRGVAFTLIFAGTLFGGYALTITTWRDYYFDPTSGP